LRSVGMYYEFIRIHGAVLNTELLYVFIYGLAYLQLIDTQNLSGSV